jgi:hypothetical protein
MSSARATATAASLLAAVQRLPADQLSKFSRQFQAWKGRQLATAEEAELIARIEEYSHLPAGKHKQYETLRARCEQGKLTPGDLDEYQHLLNELEARNVKRVEALAALAGRRGMTLSALMADLGQSDGVND